MIKDLPYNVFNKVPLTCFKGILNSRLHLIQTEAEWLDVLEVLLKKKLLAVDTETNSLIHYTGGRICGVAIGFELDHFYIPVRHKDSVLGGVQPSQLSMDVIKPGLMRLFNDPKRTLTFHNGKFDRHFFAEDGIDISCTMHDTRTMLQLYDENIPGELKVACSGWTDIMGLRHAGLVHPDSNSEKKAISEWRTEEVKARRKEFKYIVEEKFNELKADVKYQSKKKSELKAIAKEMLQLHPYCNTVKEDITYDYIPILDMVQYAALDTFLTYQLHALLLPKLQKDKALAKLYVNEIQLNDVLYDIENRGMRIDIPYFQDVRQVLLDKIQASQVELENTLGSPGINLNSPDQLAPALINLGVKLTKETEASTPLKRKYCLNSKEMAKLAKRYPIAKKIVEHRKLCKIVTTYIDPLLQKNVDGVVYASFNPNVKTGRLSSGGATSAINFQTLPSKDKTIKKGFILPSDEYLYFSFDYSQVELRLTAHLSQDPILLSSYLNKEDLHLKTCCNMFGWNLKETIAKYSDENHPEFADIEQFRRIAKIINFSAIYGTSGKGLSEQIIPRPKKYENFSEDEWIAVCNTFLEKYFDAHRGVAKFLFKAKKEVKTTGQVVTELGRVRRLPHKDAVKLTGERDKRWMEGSAERQGGNALVQGLAADVFKFSLVKVHSLMQGKKSYIANLVHDSIDGFIHKSELYLLHDIKRLMEDWTFSVPIVADCSVSLDNIANKKGVKDIDLFIKEHTGSA